MSSARSNAAARQRRAGDPPGQSPNLAPGQRFTPGPGPGPTNPPPKLTVSDAIGLITLRLGRVEGIIQNMPNDSLKGDDNLRIIDDGVFTSIVQRLDYLEKTCKGLSIHHVEMSKQLESIMKTQSNIVAPVPVAQFDTSKIDSDIRDLQSSILKLHGFTMDTNQRLCEMVFQNKFDDEYGGSMLIETISANNIAVIDEINTFTEATEVFENDNETCGPTFSDLSDFV